MIIQLLEQDGIKVKRSGKDIVGPCPRCGGEDRLQVFPESDRYWCRQCEISNDAIQHLRDFRGMDFRSAAKLVGRDPNTRGRGISSARVDFKRYATQAKKAKKVFTNKNIENPLRYKKRLSDFTAYAHRQLIGDQDRLIWLATERGINLETVKEFKLGWNPRPLWRPREEFGLKVTDRKEFFFPSGLTIPWNDVRVTIRRDKIKEGQDRYHLLTGGTREPMILGDPDNNTGIIVESELDAILLKQEVSRELFIVSVGFANARPDVRLKRLLNRCAVAFLCLDSDDAGRKNAKWWKRNVPGIFKISVPERFKKDSTEKWKDITDMWKEGVVLDHFIEAALELYVQKTAPAKRPGVQDYNGGPF